MKKNEIIEVLKPKCNGYDLPLSLNIDLIAELLVNKQEEAINYTHSCKSDSEQLDCDRQFINAGTLQGQAMKRCLKCLKYTKAN
jgi:hypothetical protein